MTYRNLFLYFRLIMHYGIHLYISCSDVQYYRALFASLTSQAIPAASAAVSAAAAAAAAASKRPHREEFPAYLHFTTPSPEKLYPNFHVKARWPSSSPLQKVGFGH